MAKVTVMVEGEATEIPGTLQDLLNAFGAGRVVEEKRDAKEATTPEPWTKEQVQRVWDMLKPGAKEVLREIAKHPVGCSFDKPREVLNLPGLTVAGRMSSVGFALSRLGYDQGKPEFLSRDYHTRMYHMDLDVGESIRQITAERHPELQ